MQRSRIAVLAATVAAAAVLAVPAAALVDVREAEQLVYGAGATIVELERRTIEAPTAQQG